MTEPPILKSHRKPDVGTTIVEVGALRFGDGSYPVIAGPGVIESSEQMLEAALAAAEGGASMLRGGVFGNGGGGYGGGSVGDAGLWMLQTAGQDVDLPTAAEVAETRHVDFVAEHVDVLHVGAANMQNFGLLSAVGASQKPCILERGASATIDEWLYGAEYILNEGNDQIILCERGITTFETRTRDTLDLSSVPVVQRVSHLPVIVDPSAAGARDIIGPLALGARAVGADGLMVSIHPDPSSARSHAEEQLDRQDFLALMDALGVPAMRDEIDTIDREIVRLISRRLRRSVEIGRVKVNQDLPLYAPDREEELIAEVRGDAERSGIDTDYAEEIFRLILAHSRRVQRRELGLPPE
jgi:3-deoxy-7-phosphoheptulonate synthase